MLTVKPKLEAPSKVTRHRLHSEIARVNPDKRSADVIIMVSSKFGQHVLSQAWNPDSPVLLDWMVYEDALLYLEASEKQQHRVRQLFNLAVDAAKPPATEREKQKTGVAEAKRLLLNAIPPEKYQADLYTERLFMEHLRTLRTRGGLSLRRISTMMVGLDAKAARSHSALAVAFERDTVPADEHMVKALLVVLITALPTGELKVQAHTMLEDCLHSWRELIGARHRHGAEPTGVEQILAALEAAQAAADVAGKIEAAGLSSALEIVRGLQSRAATAA